MNTFILAVVASCCAELSAQVEFQRVVVDSQFKAEACAAADMNHDGKTDIIAGENWYEAPDWKPHKFRDMPIAGGYADTRLDEIVDLDNDGLLDVVSVHRAALIEWLENPEGGDGGWPRHKIAESTITEGVVFVDLDGDGRGEFLGAVGKPGETLAGWFAGRNPLQPWERVEIGPKGGDEHGIGIGDLNRDGRDDIITRLGWYDAPADRRQPGWKFHPLDRGDTQSPIVYDFDGDGDQDIAASSPHNYGLWWWEQVPREGAEPAWEQHLIDESISQMHVMVGADVDGDGDLDLISGKRYHARNGDPGTDDPAMLVWYELRRDGHKAEFVRHVIDEDSGVGCTLHAVDIDGDHDLDIVTSNKKGVFLFVQKGSPKVLPLFNGRDLANWIGDTKVWSVERSGRNGAEKAGAAELGDGVIVGKTAGLKQNTFLVSRDHYDNFILTLQVKLEPDSANSGIQFRSTPRDDGECVGYQADIGVGWWGSIYEEQARGLLNNGYKGRGDRAVIKNGWNRYVLYAVGDELRVEINGTVCTHLRDAQRKTGIIGLQGHSGGPTDVRFRNIELRKVEK